jgi:hypothetical protein
MDLLLATTSTNPPKTPSPRGEGQRASASGTTQADSTSPVESGPFDALLGGCVQENSTPVTKTHCQERPLPMLGAGGHTPHSLETGRGGTSQETGWLPGKQTAAGESWPGLLDAEAARSLKGQASQAVEAGSPRAEDGASARHPRGVASDGLRADGVRDETAEGAFLSKEGGASKGETQEAGHRAMLSRMEALKGMEQAGEHQAGDSKPAGHTGQGENTGSLAGKDGASLKQEVQVDLPAKPAPPPVTSTQAPAHTVQAGSGGTFRILRDAVHMRIQDEELGPMRWHIHLRGGRITAEAIVETSRVQQLLQNHQDVLEAKLNAMGVEVEEFDVSVDKGSHRFAAFSESDGSRHTGRSTEDHPHDVIMDPVVSKMQRHQDRGLDLYV